VDEQERQKAFISALTTEHFVLQSAASATIAEASGRTSLYVYSVSSSLVAIGFSLQADDVFWPLIAAIIPSLLVLGVFTIVRLMETSVENQQLMRNIAQIRGYYRTLTPEGIRYFSAENGRWPETDKRSAARFGTFIAICTTAASMIAIINSIIAGAGAALLVRRFFVETESMIGWLIGVLTALSSLIVLFLFQYWFFNNTEPETG
jgi:hypothetical protein